MAALGFMVFGRQIVGRQNEFLEGHSTVRAARKHSGSYSKNYLPKEPLPFSRLYGKRPTRRSGGSTSSRKSNFLLSQDFAPHQPDSGDRKRGRFHRRARPRMSSTGSGADAQTARPSTCFFPAFRVGPPSADLKGCTSAETAGHCHANAGILGFRSTGFRR